MHVETSSLQPIELTGDELVIDIPAHEVRRGDRRIRVTHLEFQLISTLIAANGRVLTRDELLATWGGRRPSSRRAIDIHVARLRRKLGEGIIETVRQVGYKCPRTSAVAGGAEVLDETPTGLQPHARSVRLEPVALATTA